MEIKNWITRIKNADSITGGEQIDIFALFLETVHLKEYFTVSDIKDCYGKLRQLEYSNINSYLLRNSKREKGKPIKFIKTKSGFHLEAKYKTSLMNKVGETPEPTPSTEFFPLSLLESTRRGYLQKVGKQAVICYDTQQYDAAFVMFRKLIEILIIECFERHNLANVIKDTNGDFFYLSDLIRLFLEEKSWNISRNTQKAIPKIKKFADLSAHNRRFVALKSDLDPLKDDLRISVDELLHLIDYPNWKKGN